MRSAIALTAILMASAAYGSTTISIGDLAAGQDDAAELLHPARVANQICRAVKKRTEFFNPGFQIAAAQAAAAVGGSDSGPALYDNLGTLTEPVTTRSPDAQRYFDQGLRLAYAFNHGEAVRAFRKAQAIDPTCAMCYWGEAYALGPEHQHTRCCPMRWHRPSRRSPSAMALKDGRQRARAGADRRPWRALLRPIPAADRKALDAAYADAMTGVAARVSRTTTRSQVLFADALMNLQPWDYWEPDKRTPKGRTAEQVAALERVLRRNPDHPGAIHLYIHTVEASTTPERAEPYADRLNGQMPGAGPSRAHAGAHLLPGRPLSRTRSRSTSRRWRPTRR